MNNHPVIRYLFDHRYLLLLLLFTSAVYFKGITPSFSSDDFVHLENNIHFENLADAAEVFIKPYGREYRPLVRLSLWFNHLMGDSALAYKISNLLMHLLCVALLYGLMLRLGVARITALLAASIFALHPIHTTSVLFILGRTDLVAAMFYLAALYCVAGWKNSPGFIQHAIAFVWFAAALLSKELAITLPAMMLSIMLCQRQSIAITNLSRSLLILWPYALTTLIYLAARLYQWQSMPAAVAVYSDFSPLHIVTNYVEWIFALLYPFDLYVAREWQMLYSHWFIVFTVFACLLLATVMVYIGRPIVASLLRSPLLWLGFMWMLITLIPMAGGNSHRWYLYLPSAGLSLIVAAVWPLTYPHRRRLVTWLLALILLIYTVETLRQAQIWHKQSHINEYLLSETKTQELRQHAAIAIANMPAGYKSAFLFTHSSFEEALRVRYGSSPKIEVLNYLNLDEQNPIAMETTTDGARFMITPNAYRYFRLRNLQIFFDKADRYTQGNFTLHIDQLDNAGRISQYRLAAPASAQVPVYYFDGEDFKRLPIPQDIPEVQPSN
ncbi:MAG: phospholipid carrier-dependent glycosyltransferase [Cellvibrio sp.]|uniref:ArnT family glycosyltransferase n=1 Tax=Cellvibrio sp. TaxID=1965322 RepID=UPI00271EB51B|nr:phospholipid carrier-dependent glycosyltransferase [Cellvibrio sp.]